MENGEKKDVYKTYHNIARWFSENRDTTLIEQNYLDRLASHIPAHGTVLDLGCGTGKPIFEYLTNKGFQVTGVDACGPMLTIAKENFPEAEFILQDMRHLNLNRKFHAIIAWHSFFHLPATDQPAMFEVFEKHIHPQGILLFTSGTEHGEAWGINGGENLFHASLDTEEYENLLTRHHFNVLQHAVKDPDCGYATVWMAHYEESRDDSAR